MATQTQSEHSPGTVHVYQTRLYEFLSDRWVFTILTVVPALALFAFINLLPMTWAFAASFFEIGAFDPTWTWTGLTNYISVLNEAGFWASMGRSAIFAAGSVAFQVVFGTGLAILLNREFRFQKLVRAVALLPYIVPTAVLSFIALWMGSPNFGVINQLLLQVGVFQNTNQFISWFGSLEWAMFSVIVTNSWKFSIFVTILVLARLQSIPDSIYEAAAVSGASPIRRFIDITLPNLKGVLFIAILLRGIWMFNKFDIVYILTGGGPASKTLIAPIYAYRTAFVDNQLGEAAAVSALLFIVLLGVALIYFYVFEPSQEVRVE